MQPLFIFIKEIYFAITNLVICVTKPVCILIKYMPFARLATSKFLILSPALTASVFVDTTAPV